MKDYKDIRLDNDDFRSLMTYSQHFEVPDYQRGYDWGQEHFSAFWEDVQHHFDKRVENEPETFFLGNLIVEEPEAKEKNSRYRIIDGQQRITTLFILAIAMRDKAKIKAKKSENNTLKESYLKLSTTIDEEFINYYRYANRNDRVPRLYGAAGEPFPVRDVLNFISCPERDPEKFPTKDDFPEMDGRKINACLRRVQVAYDYFYEALEAFKDLKDFWDFKDLVDKIVFFVLRVDKEERAFNLFETTNARGKDLEVADLLKNHFFTKIKGGSDEILPTWKEILENAGENKLVTMLKHFNYVYGIPAKKKGLYKALKVLIKDFGASEILRELKAYSEFHKIMHMGSRDQIMQWIGKADRKDRSQQYQMHISVAALRMFSAELTYPMIYGFFKKYNDFYIDDKSFRKQPIEFLKALEHFHFKQFKISKESYRCITNEYPEFAGKLYQSKNRQEFGEAIKLVYKHLNKTITPFEAKYKVEFIELDYKKNDALIRYIFHKIEDHLVGGDPLGDKSLWDPNTTVKGASTSKNISIEHFWPQNLSAKSDGVNNPEEFEQYRKIHESMQENGDWDDIGNIIIIENRKNSKLSNAVPPKKRKLLENMSNLFEHHKRFLNKYDLDGWNKDQIKNRGLDLAKFCYDKVFPIGKDSNGKSLNHPKIHDQQIQKW